MTASGVPSQLARTIRDWLRARFGIPVAAVVVLTYLEDGTVNLSQDYGAEHVEKLAMTLEIAAERVRLRRGSKRFEYLEKPQ